MSHHDSELDAVTVKILLQEQTKWGEHTTARLTAMPVEDERILEPDEIAAELVPDHPQPPARARHVPPPDSSLAALRGAFQLGSSYASALRPQPAAAGGSQELHTMRLELARLHSQMRARDAYLIELEQALDQSTRQLVAAGLGSVEDAQRLLGRVRGQAFRIAELESELRHATQELSTVHRRPRGGHSARATR